MTDEFDNPVSVASAGIDYFCFTMKHDNPEVITTQNRFMQLMTEAIQAGDSEKIASPQGYGGFMTKHLFFGSRQDGVMFRASSSIADQVAREVLYSGTEVKATRIDFQTTIKSERPMRGFASQIHGSIRDSGERKGRQSKIKTTLIEDPGGGDSISVGSRSSSRFLRVYDKSAEQRWQIEGNQYRFELEVKKGQAVGCWDMVKSAADVRYLSMSLVAGALLVRGLPVPWSEECQPMDLPSTYYQTNDERRAKWIIEQVAPVARRIDDPGLRARIQVAFGF